MKKFLLTSLFLLLLVVLPSQTFAAANENASPNALDNEIPEKNGTYDDPGHPGIKVRVFVHHERLGKAELPAFSCNLTDPDSSAIVSPTGWHLPSTVTYRLNPSSVPTSVGGVNLPVIAQNSFSDWASASASKVTFVRGADTTVDRDRNDGQNIIAWGRTSGSALGVTYVRYQTAGGLVVDVDTIMNKKFSWKWANSAACAFTDVYDAENILTHELGHWMGLDDEYDAPSYQHATMYGYGAKGEVKKNTLSTGDILGTYAIYNP